MMTSSRKDGDQLSTIEETYWLGHANNIQTFYLAKDLNKWTNVKITQKYLKSTDLTMILWEQNSETSKDFFQMMTLDISTEIWKRALRFKLFKHFAYNIYNC